MMEQQENSADDVNIEEIMQDIHRQILSKKGAGKASLPVSGRRFSSAFYEELYRADLLQGDGGLKLEVTRSSIPVVGPMIEKLRGKFHQLVLFYVNQAVIPQNEFNDHLFQAITLLSQELEDEVKRSDDTNS
jgi:hypothetical protein